MTAIAMSCELGTRGREIADAVGCRLGLAVVHHEAVTERLARRLPVDTATMLRYLAGQTTPIERWRLGDRQLGRYGIQEVLELAIQGNVLIRGWGVVPTLARFRHVACIRIEAPVEARVRVLMQQGMRDCHAARARIFASDAALERAMHRFFSWDFRDAASFDLTLNSDRLDIAQCVEQVAQLAQGPPHQETAATAAALHSALAEARVHTRRYHDFAGALGEPYIDVAGHGAVSLTGAADHELAITKIEQSWHGRGRTTQDTMPPPPRTIL